MKDLEKKISVIMIVTNSAQRDEALKWIKRQSMSDETEVVLLDNFNNMNFTSAAKALNEGALKAAGDVLIFMHQDVYLWDTSTLERCSRFLTNNNNSILGLAGRNHGSETVTDIYETVNHIHRGNWTNGKIIEVETVDECMFAMKKELWERLKFDEECCNDWHCYATEICMHNGIMQGKNYVIPCKACHESIGNAKQVGFVHTVKKIVRKYKGKCLYITSCCIQIKCTWTAYYLYALKFNIKKLLNNFIAMIGS